MGIEIERKYSVKPKLSIQEILKILENSPHETIKDYYFNPMTRLRIKNGKKYITIKSLEMFKRDEWEFELASGELDFIPAPILVKERYYYTYENNKFEVNIYKDIRDKNDRPLVIVEIEMSSEISDIKLPDWIDHDCTYHPNFYNYTIFGHLLEDYQKRVAI